LVRQELKRVRKDKIEPESCAARFRIWAAFLKEHAALLEEASAGADDSNGPVPKPGT
jgi:hypothetical protein